MAVSKPPYVQGTYILEMIDSFFESVRLLAEADEQPTGAPPPAAPAAPAAPAVPAAAPAAPAEAGGDDENLGYDAGWHAAHRGGELKQHAGKSSTWNKGYQDGFADGSGMQKLTAIPHEGRSPEQAKQAHTLAAGIAGRHTPGIVQQLHARGAKPYIDAASIGGASTHGKRPDEPYHEPTNDWMTRVRGKKVKKDGKVVTVADAKNGHTDAELSLRNFANLATSETSRPSDLKKHLLSSVYMHHQSWSQNKQKYGAGAHEKSGHAAEPGGVGTLDTATHGVSGRAGASGVAEEPRAKLAQAMQSAVDRMPHPEGWQPGQRSSREFLKRHIVHGMDQSGALQDMGVDHTTGANRQWASDQAQRLMRDPELMKAAREVHGGMQGEAHDILSTLITGLFLESGTKWVDDAAARNVFLSWLHKMVAK